MENDLHIKTIALCTAIIAAVCAVFWDKLYVIIPIFILLAGFLCYKKIFGKIFTFILLVLFACTVLYAHYREPNDDVLVYYASQKVTLLGEIYSLPSKSATGKTKFVFKADKVIDYKNNEVFVDAKTQAFLDKEITDKFNRGDKLSLDAEIFVPQKPKNEGEFDYGKYLANDGIYTLSTVHNVKTLSEKPSLNMRILRKIDCLRERVIEIHSNYLNKDKTQILGGIVFGSEAIKPSAEIKRIFIESGLYHLLAASGMNVAFIFGIWFFLMIRLKMPYRLVIVTGAFVVLFYSMMTGLPPSVTRATWMLELGLLAKLIDRKADNNVILLFVCAVLLLYNPALINNIGFLLSFVVTFGLLYCTNPILEKIKFLPPKISGWIIIPLVAQIFAIPIQMYFFQTISVYSIIANMLVIPFMAIISFCGFISSIFALIPKIGHYLCFVLDKVNEPLLSFLLFVASWVSSFPNNIAHVAKLNYIEIILYYILVFLFIYMLKKNFKTLKTNIAALLILVYLIFSFTSKGYTRDLTFTFLSVGEADSIFITTPNNKKILIDAGRSFGKDKNSATSVILPFFSTNGITSIDMMLLTHPDSDHIGGSVDILENIKVNELVTNGEKAKNKTYLRLQEYIKNNNQVEKIITEPEEISPDEEVSIIAFKPPDTKKNTQNDTSIILLFKYKDFDAILMGDNEINSYELLKTNLHPSGDIELFKLGHHGSKNSVNKKMAQLISPKVSVVSVGENSYGHPNSKAMSVLRGSRIYRTDMDNTVRIKTNGRNFDVYTYNPQSNRWQKDTREP
ncbi:MAG: DNA internalization-related competence protein ComEC/Rec2 [bacterium]|nr:DNA internalization-related competence protein ComEC/Rec2 [bacterium]